MLQRNDTAPRRSLGCRLLLVADDFGRSVEINEAVIDAHRRGTLTGASLMVAGAACQHAVALARQTPTLNVGLHVVVAGGRACLSPSEIPALVDSQGQFPDSPAKAGLLYAFSARARAQLARELRAQFERFAQTGLRLAHVDGHMHMHVHPSLLRLLEPLLVEYRVPRVRLPRGELWPALRASRKRMVQKMALAGVFALLSAAAARRLHSLGIATTERTFGLLQSGEMSERYVSRVLAGLHSRSAEIYFHPTTGARLDRLGPNPGDYATLRSSRIKQLLRAVAESSRCDVKTFRSQA